MEKCSSLKAEVVAIDIIAIMPLNTANTSCINDESGRAPHGDLHIAKPNLLTHQRSILKWILLSSLTMDCPPRPLRASSTASNIKVIFSLEHSRRLKQLHEISDARILELQASFRATYCIAVGASDKPEVLL